MIPSFWDVFLRWPCAISHQKLHKNLGGLTRPEATREKEIVWVGFLPPCHVSERQGFFVCCFSGASFNFRFLQTKKGTFLLSGPGFNMYSEPVKSIALVFAVNCNWHCAVGIGGGFQHVYVGGGWNDRFAGLCETLTQRITRSCPGIACGMEVGCRIRSAGMVGARLMTLPATTFSPQPKTWQVPVGVSFAEARSSTLWIRILH